MLAGFPAGSAITAVRVWPSAPPGQDAVLLAICGQVAVQAAGTAAPKCTRPELAVLNR